MSVPTGLILPPPAVEQDYLYTVSPYTSAPTAWPAANMAIGMILPKRSTPLSIVKMGIPKGAVAGNYDLGLYYQSAADTLTLIDHIGATAASGSADEALVSLPLGPYLYDGRTDIWAFCAVDNNTLTVARSAGSATATFAHKLVLSKVTSYVLPASFTISGMTGTSTEPCIYCGA